MLHHVPWVPPYFLLEPLCNGVDVCVCVLLSSLECVQSQKMSIDKLTEHSAAHKLCVNWGYVALVALPPQWKTVSLHVCARSHLLCRPWCVKITSRGKTSAGLLWLRTLSSHTCDCRDSSALKRPKSTSLQLWLADQPLRKAPLTASLSVKKTALHSLRLLSKSLKPRSRLRISSSWIAVSWSVLMIMSKTSELTCSLKKPRQSPVECVRNSPNSTVSILFKSASA